MGIGRALGDPEAIASAIATEVRALDTPTARRVVRRTARTLDGADPSFVLDVSRALLPRSRWLAFELVASHQAAFRSLGEAELEELGQGIASWDAVDAFARTLAGPAWLRGQVSDGLIDRWAGSADRWWRRAALVATVALNTRSHGGMGDTGRTLAVCRLLVSDRDDMVVKAMSWALRALVAHDPGAVRAFLSEYEGALASRVQREVRHKLATGLKHPRRDGADPHLAAMARGEQFRAEEDETVAAGVAGLSVEPLTPERWPALEALFGRSGASNGCWCMYWRLGPAYRRRPREDNREALRRRVEQGPPPGLLAFDGSRAVGWCQLTQREELAWLQRRRAFAPVDDAPVWALSCFYVRRGYRRRGVMAALIDAALRAAKRGGAPALEAYPVDTTHEGATRNVFTGVATAFLRAGFVEVARRAPARPLLRHDLEGVQP